MTQMLDLANRNFKTTSIAKLIEVKRNILMSKKYRKISAEK